MKKSNILVLGSIGFIVAAIFITTSLVPKKTQTKSNASKSTTLSLSSTNPLNTGQSFSLNIALNPGNNYVSYVQVVLNYDSSKIVPAGSPITPGIIPETNPPQQFGIFDGPTNTCNGTQCTLSVALSIGNTFTNAVKVQANLAQVNFIAVGPTDSAGTQIAFDNTTQVYSIAPSDSSNENVLLSTTPATVVISGQAITVTPGPSVTPNPSNTTTPPPGSGQTTGNLSVHFEAIDGDNNLNPKHPQRKLLLFFFKTNNFSAAPAVTVTDYVSHIVDDLNGTFTDQIADLSSVPPGAYYVLAKSPEGSLREQLSPQQVTIVAGQNNMLSGSKDANGNNSAIAPPNFRMGDLNNDNIIDLKDYNTLVDCYSSKANSPSCKKHNISDTTKGLFADVNDDGVVNGIDYNILIRHFGENGY